MGLESPIGSKINFSGELIFESAAWFFVIILKFIFTPIFEIKIHEKKDPTASELRIFKILLFGNCLFRRSGLPDNMSTEALVGGYFNSIIFLGEFLGPVIGGQLMDKLNNIPEAVGIFTIICFVVVSYFIFSDFLTHRCRVFGLVDL